MLLIFFAAMVGHAQAALKRALFYGPTSDPNGLAETFVNSSGSTFAPIGSGDLDSQVWDVTVWQTKTTADFAKFAVIVFGDQPLGSNDATRWNAAIANRTVWAVATTGNALVFGGDPDSHTMNTLVQQALRFGADQTDYTGDVTGIYVALSQVHFGTIQGPIATPETVELLKGIGIFKAIIAGSTACANHPTVVASHPVLDCLSSEYLANWNCSAHQGFHSWPSSFIPLAIVTDTDTATPGYTAPCSSYADCGKPALVYILARGNFKQLTATPCVQAGRPGNPGDQRTVTAKFKKVPSGVPIQGSRIGFNVAGANSVVGLPSNYLTDANGQVSFTYSGGINSGKDVITVFVDVNANNLQEACEPQTSVICNWAASIVTVIATDPNAAEPSNTGTFRIARTGGTSLINVAYCMGGTATAGTDYTLSSPQSGIATIPANGPFVDVVLTPVDDTLIEGPEKAIMTLQDGTGYAVGSPFQATVTIADSVPVVTIISPAEPAYESDLQPSIFTFQRAASGLQASVNLTVFFTLPVTAGGALLGADYTLSPPMTGAITIPAGSSSVTMQLLPLQDSRNEGTEMVTVNLLADPSYVLGTPSTGTVQIRDNDTVPLPLSYTLTEIGPVSKPSYGMGVNSSGVVAGYYQLLSQDWRGFLWQNGSLTTVDALNSPPGCPGDCGQSYGMAINDSGVVVGYGGDGINLPFVWTTGAPAQLGILDPGQLYGNFAMAINNSGNIVGSSKNSAGKSRAVLWQAGTTFPQDWQTLAGFSASKESFATGINLVGRVVGKSMILSDNTTFHAFRTRALLPIRSGNADDLGNLTGVEAANSEASWINDLDEVVGATVVSSGQYHAFWKDGNSAKNQAFVDLGVLSGDDYSMALGLNNTGHSVGYSKNTPTGVQRAIVWFNNGTMYDLLTKVNNGSGWTLKSAEAINNSGWVVGWGVKSGYDRAFLLVPNY